MTGTYKTIISGVLASLALAACATGTSPPAGDTIVLTANKEGLPGGCNIEMHQTYPADIAPQERQMSIRETENDLVKSGGVWSLPRPASDHRVVDNGDGTKTLRVFQWSFSPCRDVTLIVDVGACQSGQCLPVRLDAGPLPEGVAVSRGR